MKTAHWMLGLGGLLTLAACRKGDAGDVAPDPPTDGLLVVNLQLTDFDNGPMQNVDKVEFLVNSIIVRYRPDTANGPGPLTDLQVASGPVPLVILDIESEHARFAGEYWVPPGAVESVKFSVSSIVGYSDNSSHPILIEGQSAGELAIDVSGNPVHIAPQAPSGLSFQIDGSSTSIAGLTAGQYNLLDDQLAGSPESQYRRFPYSWDELVVHYVPGTSPLQQAQIEAEHGGVRTWTSQNGKYHILKFDGIEWWENILKYGQFRKEEDVGIVFPNPVLVNAAAVHDPTYWDDPGYSEAESAALAGVGLQTTWSASTGDRSIRVGIVDDGFDINHPDLVNQLYVNLDELPRMVCGLEFETLFNLDGDGQFSLNDLNNPTDPADLTYALSELQACVGVTLSANSFDSASSADDGLFQGSDLLAAFADGNDSYTGNDSSNENGFADDFFGASFTNATNDADCALVAEDEWDVYPFDSADIDNSVHGTLTSGLISAEPGNASNIPGIMGPSSIVMARISSACGGGTTGDDGGFGEFSDAVDYLANTIGVDIIVIGKAQALDLEEGTKSAIVKNLNEDFEEYPDVVFVVPAPNEVRDCDDELTLCWPAGATSPNVLSVLATGVDFAGGDFETMTGEWSHSTTNASSGTAFGSQSIDIGAPGFLYWSDTSGGSVDFDYGLRLIKAGQAPNYNGFNPGVTTISGGTSLTTAFAGGVAGLVLSSCPTMSADEVVSQISTSATLTSSPVTIRSINGAFLDSSAVEDAVLSCP